MDSKKTITADKIVEAYNDKGMNLEIIGNYYNTSKSTVQRILVKAGYKLNKVTKKYESNISHEQISIVSHDTNVSRETIKNENIVNRTYAISEKIDKAMKLKAIIEGKKPIDVVREALESYIEGKYFDM